MASKNYVIGRGFEYRVMNFFRKNSYYCMRAFGSKGLVDVIAIPPKNINNIHNITLGIQAKKNGYVPKEELEKLRENEHKWQMMILISWSDKKSRKLRFRTLNDTEIAIGALERKEPKIKLKTSRDLEMKQMFGEP